MIDKNAIEKCMISTFIWEIYNKWKLVYELKFIEVFSQINFEIEVQREKKEQIFLAQTLNGSYYRFSLNNICLIKLIGF